MKQKKKKKRQYTGLACEHGMVPQLHSGREQGRNTAQESLLRLRGSVSMLTVMLASCRCGSMTVQFLAVLNKFEEFFPLGAFRRSNPATSGV